MTSSVHIDNKRKDILIFGLGPAQWLDDTMSTAETQYSINFSRSNKENHLSLNYNESFIYLVNNSGDFLAKNKKQD